MKRFNYERDRIVTVHNYWGSVEHFYHFMFGFLIPLERHIFENSNKNINYIVRSCGPVMDQILKDIVGEKISILNHSDHSDLLQSAPLEQLLTLSGLDHPKLYSAKILTEFSSRVTTRMLDDTTKQPFEISSSTKEPHILFIDRGIPHEFYMSETSEKSSASKQRRSIPNMYEIFKAVQANFPNSHYVQLEDSPIKEQISLFQGADVIIAQHGAALSNLLWCTPGSLVIEVTPLLKYRSPPFFRSIAEMKNLTYERIMQAMSHSKVKPSIILKTLSRHYNSVKVNSH